MISRKLISDRECSKDDYSPYHLWMLRGIEANVSVSEHGIKKLLKSPPLVPIQKMFLPEPIKCLVFSEVSSHLYFTTPDSPNVINAQFFPNPLANPTSAQKNFMSKSKKYFEDNSFPSIKIECDDIIALSVTGSKIFALTVIRGRTMQNNSWKIFRYDINEDKGIVKTGSDQVAVLDFSPDLYEIDKKISFVAVGKTIFEANLYISGMKGAHIYWGKFKPSQKISPKILIPELSSPNFDTASSLVLTSGYRSGDTGRKDYLLALDTANSKIYNIIIEEGKWQALYLTPALKNIPIIGASAMSYISINTSDLTIEISPSGQTLFFYLIVSPFHKKVWTISDTGNILPLIGGGNKTELAFNPITNPFLVDKSDDSNLLNLDIGDVDSICIVNNSFVVFGTKNKTGWKALLLPQMINIFKKKPTDYSRKNVGSKAGDIKPPDPWT